MKNKDYFLSTIFHAEPIKEVQKFLEKEGWIIKTIKSSGKIRIKLYESDEDFDFWNDMACTSRQNTFEEALLACVLTLKEKYAAQN